MKNLKLVLTLLFVGLSLSIFAQRKADVVIPYDQNIETILLSPLSGSVIVKEKDKISCYNPVTKQTDWKVTKEEIGKMSAVASAQKTLDALSSPDLMKIFESTDRLAFIPKSPFVRGTIGDKDVIINTISGKLVFNSGTKSYKIVRSEFLLEENSFLFVATDGKKFSCVLYDLESGSEKWATELASVESFMKALSSVFSLKGNVTPPTDKLELVQGYIYTLINAKLYKLDKNTGKISWNTDFPMTDFYLSQSGKNVTSIKNAGSLFSTNQAMNIINAETGSPIWKEDIKTKRIAYLEDWNDRILVAHTSGFNFYSYADGSKIWKKDAKGDNIQQVIPIDHDYLYIADKEMTLIDNDGKPKWKKFVEISDNTEDPVHYLGKVDNNRVFYLTGTYGNMVDFTSGKKIWKGNIEFAKDRPLLYAYDENANAFLVYNDKKIFKFDPNASEKPEPIAKLKEIKDDKSMEGIELFDWGLCLVGQSDVIGVGMDGVTKYHNTYKEPGGGTRKNLHKASRFASGLMRTAEAISQAEITFSYRDKNGNLVESEPQKNFNEKTQAKGAALGNAAEGLDATFTTKVKARFNALKQNNEYAFVLTKGESGETRQLVKVKKADGQEVDKISVDNNNPIYEVDPVTDDVYYASKNELRIYSKK